MEEVVGLRWKHRVVVLVLLECVVLLVTLLECLPGLLGGLLPTGVPVAVVLVVQEGVLLLALLQVDQGYHAHHLLGLPHILDLQLAALQQVGVQLDVHPVVTLSQLLVLSDEVFEVGLVLLDAHYLHILLLHLLDGLLHLTMHPVQIVLEPPVLGLEFLLYLAPLLSDCLEQGVEYLVHLSLLLGVHVERLLLVGVYVE